MTMQQVVKNKGGRPRLPQPNIRIECMVPKEVMELLISRERQGHGYRTRIAARVLCNWASHETGKPIASYNSLAQ